MKTNQSYKKAFFLVRWDLVLLLSSSQIYFCPYSFDQKFATPTTLIHLSAFDLPKSALIYSECQMNRSCCLLSLWPQNRSLNFLWSFLCLDAKSYQYDDDRRDVKFHVLASQTIEQVTIQVCDCKLWRWSTQKAYHQYLSVSAITTNQAPYMLQQGIVHLSQNIDRRIWLARMRWTPPAQSRSISSHLIPYSFPYISYLGCQQRMSWPHVAQATMQGWPPLIFCQLVTKSWVVVIGFGSISHLKYHGQRLHSLLYACMELDFNSNLVSYFDTLFFYF